MPLVINKSLVFLAHKVHTAWFTIRIKRILAIFNPPGNNKTIHLQLLYYVLKYIILSIIMQENRITKIKFCQLSQIKIIQLLNVIRLLCVCSCFLFCAKKTRGGPFTKRSPSLICTFLIRKTFQKMYDMLSDTSHVCYSKHRYSSIYRKNARESGYWQLYFGGRVVAYRQGVTLPARFR